MCFSEIKSDADNCCFLLVVFILKLKTILSTNELILENVFFHTYFISKSFQDNPKTIVF